MACQYIKGGGTNPESPFGSWEVQERGMGRLRAVKESRKKRKFLIGLGKAKKGIRFIQKRSQVPSKKGVRYHPKKDTDKDLKKDVSDVSKRKASPVAGFSKRNAQFVSKSAPES